MATLAEIIEDLTGQPVDARTAAELQRPVKGWIESRTVEECGYSDAVSDYVFPAADEQEAIGGALSTDGEPAG